MPDPLRELAVAAGAELATRRRLQLNPATIAYAKGMYDGLVRAYALTARITEAEALRQVEAASR
jgi:hypothetical protein